MTAGLPSAGTGASTVQWRSGRGGAHGLGGGSSAAKGRRPSLTGSGNGRVEQGSVILAVALLPPAGNADMVDAIPYQAGNTEPV